MRKFIGLIILCTPLTIMAQRWQVTGFGGLSNYQGDIQEKRFTTTGSHFAFGLGASYDLMPHVILRGGLVYGKISGDDKQAEDNSLRLRNLNFTSQLLEFNLMGAYDILDYNRLGFTPYLIAGIAVFGFDPYTHDTLGGKYYLQPLSTEGQGLASDRKAPYHRVQLSIPFGGGVKFRINDQVSVAYEIGLRYTFSDYLDDLSTRYIDQDILLAAKGPKAVELAYRGDELKDGNPVYPADATKRGGEEAKDWYYFQGIQVSYRLHAITGMFGSGKDRTLRNVQCPKNVN